MTKRWISNWSLGEKIPPTRKHRLRKGVSEKDACYRRVRERLMCEELRTGGVVVCDCVCVCMSSVCVCVSVCMWVPDLGLNPDSDTEKCCGGNLGMLKEQKCRNENSVTEVRSQWLWKGGADGCLCKLCKQCGGFWRQALEEKEKLSLLAVLSPDWLSHLQNKRKVVPFVLLGGI